MKMLIKKLCLCRKSLKLFVQLVLITTYSIKSKLKVWIFLKNIFGNNCCFFPAYLFVKDDWVQKYSSALCTLAYCSKIEFNVNAPVGCAILTVSDKCEVHLLLKGFIDPVKELEKIVKKQEQLKETRNKLEQTMSAGDYTVKVPEKVREANDEKLSQTNTELERIEKAIETLKLMD